MNQKYILLLSTLFLFSCSDEGVNPVYGCMDENASNYCEECNIDDGTCEQCPDDPVSSMTGFDNDCLPLYSYTYEDDIYDIFNQNGCLGCHSQDSWTGLDLSSYNGTIAGGNNGPIISDMSPASSLLITTFDSGGLMCLQGYCELPSQNIIPTWISEGAPE